MSRVVKEGELLRVSPSQLKTFLDCPRKWYYGKVLNVPEPKKPHLDLGEKIHKQLEDWYLEAKEPEHESIHAALRLPEVPPRSEDVIIEMPRNYDLGLVTDGVTMRGRIDVRLPPVDGQFTILDWKSTSSWDWIKTPDDLARDAQGIVYLKYGFKEYPDATSGIFRHVYIRTKGGKGARSVQTDPLTRAEVDDKYRGLEKVVAKMKEAARLQTPDDVEPNPKECQKYGGCPYRDICPVMQKRQNLFDFLEDTEEENTMTLKEKLALKKGINPPDAAVPPPVEAYVPPAPSLDQWSKDAVVEAQAPAVERPTTSMVFFDAQGGAVVTQEALHLYVNCRPVKDDRCTWINDLEGLIADRTPEVLNSLREQGVKIPDYVLDIRQVPYGAGTAAMAASFRKNPPTGNLTARTGGVCDGVLDVLIPLANTVVIGT